MNKQEAMALFVDDVEARKKAISDYIKSDAPYEDRLEVYKNTPKHLQTHKGWCLTLYKFEKKYGEIVWYDDFHIERYEDFDLADIEDYVDDWSEEKIKDFYEEAMERGIHSFTYDW